VLLGSLGLSVIYWGCGRIRDPLIAGRYMFGARLDVHYHGVIGGHL
jgi:hypothetical protein